MEKNDNLVKEENSKKVSIREIIILLISICFPIIYIVIDTIQGKIIYTDWESRYDMIYIVGNKVKENSFSLAIIFFILYVLLMIVLKDKKKIRHIILMLVVLYILNLLFGFANSWA